MTPLLIFQYCLAVSLGTGISVIFLFTLLELLQRIQDFFFFK